MFQPKASFSGFSVDDLAKAKEFYTETLGLKLDKEGFGFSLHLPGGGRGFVPKERPSARVIYHLELSR